MCKCTPAGHEVHPTARARVNLLGVFAGWLRYGGTFRQRRLKKVVNFFGKKVHPHRQNPGYAYAMNIEQLDTAICNVSILSTVTSGLTSS